MRAGTGSTDLRANLRKQKAAFGSVPVPETHDSSGQSNEEQGRAVTYLAEETVEAPQRRERAILKSPRELERCGVSSESRRDR